MRCYKKFIITAGRTTEPPQPQATDSLRSLSQQSSRHPGGEAIQESSNICWWKKIACFLALAVPKPGLQVCTGNYVRGDRIRRPTRNATRVEPRPETCCQPHRLPRPSRTSCFGQFQGMGHLTLNLKHQSCHSSPWNGLYDLF